MPELAPDRRSPSKVSTPQMQKAKNEVPVQNRIRTKTIDMTGSLPKQLDKTVALDDKQRASFREQRLALLEFVKDKDEFHMVLPDDDDISILEPQEQWSKVAELDKAAEGAGLNAGTFRELVMIRRSAHGPDTDATNGSNAHISAESTTADASMGTQTAEKIPPSPCTTIKKEEEKKAEDEKAAKLTAEANLEKEEAAREAALQEAAEIAARAQKNFEEMQQRALLDFPNAAIAGAGANTQPNPAARVLAADDYFSDTEQEIERISDRDLRNMRNELRATTQGTITAHSMIGELNAQLLSSLLVFLPRDWTPRQLINEIVAIRNAGWFERTGFAGIAQKGTPIKIKLETEQDADAVADAIYRWSGGTITTALDSPSESTRQKAQARDMLRFIIELEKARINKAQQSGVGDTYEHRYSVQWPKSRIRRKTREGAYEAEPCADFWTIMEWQPDGKVIIVARGEYDHALIEQTIYISIPKLIGFDLTRKEFEVKVRDRLAEYYLNKFTYEKDLSPLQREIATTVKTERDEQPPPLQQISDGVIDAANTHASSPPQSKSKGKASGKPKGGKGGKKSGGKSWNAGGKNGWKQDNWYGGDNWGFGKNSKGSKSNAGPKGKGKSSGKTVWNNTLPSQDTQLPGYRANLKRSAGDGLEEY